MVLRFGDVYSFSLTGFIGYFFPSSAQKESGLVGKREVVHAGFHSKRAQIRVAGHGAVSSETPI